MKAPAWGFKGLTMCNDCALRCTAVGLAIAGLPTPDSMEDAIAIMTLGEIERGQPIDTPEADMTPTGTCNGMCGRDLAVLAEEMKEESK